ncbi:glycosyltransferase [uncultured Arsenicicoccus sp.]|uniref:glycosyltransferase n=1 Tax=uncultured Arsenicicoccus sp. TaxID=491339 RepID=UPI002596AF13|nr:glycosyltransferase [uncultured Arsenicicoccus sp.]
MRVLHVTQPTEAGVANVIMALIKDQIARGWQVQLACPPTPGDLPERAREHGAEVHAWPATRSPGPGILQECRSLSRILGRAEPDVVVLHASKAGLAGRLCLRGRVPTVFMPHSWSFEAVQGAVALASQLWEGLAARWTTLDVLVSEGERETGRRARCLARRSVVIPNGVDVDRWARRDQDLARSDLGLSQDPLVVLVGRLARQKGQDVALGAWPLVRQAHPSAQLVMVGDGPDKERLQRDLVEGASLQPGGDSHPWFSAADLVIMPSRWEGMPLVLLEAMACGRCVVASDVAGVREVMGESDAIVPVEDEVALAAQISRRLADDDLRRAEGERNAQRVAAAFDVRDTTAQMAHHLLELAGARST